MLFPPGCTVVLVNGLPGDIESENSYREQIQGWLDVIARSRAGHLFVLCDQPELVKLPARPESKLIKSGRKEFLSLRELIAPAKAPLVVIVWGHGGQQRAVPVFHVRGPRLTPEDFATIADQLGTEESRWILLFRGSGAFARKLVPQRESVGQDLPGGPRPGARQVISSEFETPFTSDPIGMPLLLKLVSAGTARSFEELASQFGRAAAAWYEDRTLARTEEPTLWIPGQRPLLLARETEEEPAGASEPMADSRRTQEKPESRAKSDTPTNSEAQTRAEKAELPANWKEIRKVSPEEYPEADGVILRQSLRCTLGSSPAVVTEQEQFIQILTAEGKRFGDFDVSFAPPQEELEFLDCEVLGPDGQLARLNPDAIREAREQELVGYQQPRRKFFSLPGITAGAIIHVRFRTQWKEFPLPKISMSLPVGHELPALAASIQVSVPKDSPFHYRFEQITAPDPQVKATSYSTSYTWALEKVPAYRKEILSPPDQAPRLMVSTFPNWKEFADWYGRITRMTDEVTPEIAAKAKELIAEAKSDRDKVHALYNYVTALRYVAVPLGINSVRPHAAANVLQNQFGDCKDKANLLNTLLRSLNIDAHLVLVPRFSQAHESVPGLAFNHAISRVKLGGDTLWIDTTDDVCRFGMLPPGDPGRRVLTIDGQTTTLTQMPVPVPEEHSLTITGRIAWSEDLDGFPTELQAAARGYPDYEFRAMAREAKEQRASLPLLAARFRPLSGSFALVKQAATSVSALQEDFSWQAEGTCIGLGARSGSAAEVRPPFWVPRDWDLALHQRHSPLFMNRGYPLTLQQEFEFALPPGSKAIALPRVCENSQDPLRWRVEWVTLENDKLGARFFARLHRGELSEGETALIQEQLRTLLAALASPARVTLPQ